MEIDTRGVQCAGVSFTDALKEKYLKYIDIIQENKRKTMNYAELQELISEKTGITHSAIRVDMPFLYNSGLINDYRQNIVGEIELGNLVTKLGKSYYTLILMQNMESDETVSNKLKDLEELIIIQTIMNRKENDNEEYYVDLIKFVYNNRSIDEKEFYLMINNKDNLDELKRLTNNYRDGSMDIDLINSNNAYQYTKKILLQSNLLVEDDKRLYINDKWKDLIKYIVEG